MERQNDLWFILQHYGIKSQKNIAIEEMSELTKELCKSYRGQSDIDHLCEEIADVKIMLAQLELAVGKDGQQKIEDFYNAKIDRQMDRILKGE